MIGYTPCKCRQKHGNKSVWIRGKHQCHALRLGLLPCNTERDTVGGKRTKVCFVCKVASIIEFNIENYYFLCPKLIEWNAFPSFNSIWNSSFCMDVPNVGCENCTYLYYFLVNFRHIFFHCIVEWLWHETFILLANTATTLSTAMTMRTTTTKNCA